jgi:Domain of unknown function (DUF4349)
MEPGVAGALLAIDAVLEGHPVDPEYAELAELALILTSERPLVAEDFAASMDTRVKRRFARPAPSPEGRRRRSPRWRPLFGTAAGVAVAGVAAALVISGLNGSQPQLRRDISAAPGVAVGGATVAASTSSSATAAATSSGASAPAAPVPNGPGSGGGSSGQQLYGAAGGKSAAPPHATAHAKPSTHTTVPTSGAATGTRQVIQSAQLLLRASPTQVQQVAQQVFTIVQDNQGIVASSNVTSSGAGVRAPATIPGPYPGAYAVFQLSIPSGNLTQALGQLSRMQGARVVSRTDNTQDVTGQVGGAGIRLAEARALRRSLLKQLAAALTTQQVDSIQLQLKDADAAIARDLKALNSIKRQVAYSRVTVTVQGLVAPVAHKHNSGGGFTLRRAAHDAGRVLVVAAGVALIVLAVMVPVGLLLAALAWIGFTVRRRRREHALDLV